MKVKFLNFINKCKEIFNNNKVKIFEVVAILLIILYGYSISPKTLQNDTYYTVTIGNLINQNGIDMMDHFSWHNNLPYTYPHWLYDVIMSKIYNFSSWQGIYISVCVCSIILGLVIYFVNKKLNKNQVISFLITIGSMYMLRDYITARAQLITFIIFMLDIYCIEKFLENPKKIKYGFAILISSILIANLHCAVWPFLFVLFLPYIAEYIICEISDFIIYNKLKLFIKKRQLKKIEQDELKQKIEKQIEEIDTANKRRKEYRENNEPYKIKMKLNKNVRWLILLFIICIFTGFLTPLGTTPYTYLYKTMEGNTTQNINEHLPLTLINDTPMLVVLIIFIAIITFTNSKMRLTDLFMTGGLIYLMFSSKRQSTMLVLIGSIILNRIASETIEMYGICEVKNFTKKFITVITLIFASSLVIGFSIDYIETKNNAEYVDESTYPVKACDWILENLDINNIKLFNEYNYGSYILYRGIPVFVDSRADLYAPEFNKSEESENGKDIFMDFINTSGIGTYYGTTFKDYGITHVILYKNSKISMLIDKNDSDEYNKIYSDDNFVIYEVKNIK